MSQKAPLQDRYGEAIRSGWTCIQLGDWRVVLIARKSELADDVICRRVEGLIVTNELFREVGWSRERFAAIEAVATRGLAIVGRCFGRGAMFVLRRGRAGLRQQAGHGTVISGEQPGRGSHQSDCRAENTR